MSSRVEDRQTYSVHVPQSSLLNRFFLLQHAEQILNNRQRIPLYAVLLQLLGNHLLILISRFASEEVIAQLIIVQTGQNLYCFESVLVGDPHLFILRTLRSQTNV